MNYVCAKFQIFLNFRIELRELHLEGEFVIPKGTCIAVTLTDGATTVAERSSYLS